MAISSPITSLQASIQNAQDSVKVINQTGSNIQKNVTNISSLFERRIKRREQIVKRTNLLRKRRAERTKRENIESQIEAKSVSPKRSIPGTKFMSGSSGSLLSRILKFAGFVTLGWIINNYETWKKNAQLLISTLYGWGNGLRNFPTNITNIFKSVGNVLKAYKQNLLSFDFADTSGNVKSATDKLNLSLQNLQESFERDTSLFPDLESLLEEEEAEEDGGGDVSGDVGSDLFDVIASGEGGYDSVNRGTAGDTPGGAESIFGKSLTEMTVGEIVAAQQSGKVFAVGKYQIIPDTMIEFLKEMKISESEKFNKVTQEKFKQYVMNYKRPEVGRYIRGESDNLEEAAQALAREFASVGLSYDEAGRTRGQSRYAGSGGNAASITPEEIQEALKRSRKRAQSTAISMTPVLKKGTFVQGNTGNSRGPHFHIGPETEVYGKPEGKVAVRDAAFKASKGLIAKNEFFSFTNANIDIDPKNPPSDEQLKKFIEREQAAHASRSGGGSFGGIDIAGREGLRFPLAVSDVEDKGDGFGVSGTISGTKAFVGHGEPSSTSTPQDAQISSQTSQSSVASVTPERRGQTIVIADSGGNQQTPISAPVSSSREVNTIQDAASMLNSFMKNQLLLNLSWV